MLLAAKETVVKAQIHAGGRGKGYFKENNFKGGVKLCNTYGTLFVHALFLKNNSHKSITDQLRLRI